MKKGFTLIESMVVIGIIVVLAVIGVWHWSSATSNQALSKDRQGVVAILSEARSLSLSSKDASRYGAHIEEFKVVLFKGSTYVSTDPENMAYELNRAVHISNISIEGGGTDVIFSRLTGESDNYGTITISLISDPLSSTIVTIKNTGVIE